LLIREMILQLRTGRLDVGYFQSKFGSDIRQDFAGELGRLAEEGLLSLREGSVALTRAGLSQVDRLLPAFFEREHRGTRYT
jgi:oxygen-independent coproporphyrinogen-3 oxidase